MTLAQKIALAVKAEIESKMPRVFHDLIEKVDLAAVIQKVLSMAVQPEVDDILSGRRLL